MPNLSRRRRQPPTSKQSRIATAALNQRTVIKAPVNGYITNLTLVVGQDAAIGTRVMALIDSDSYRSGLF